MVQPLNVLSKGPLDVAPDNMPAGLIGAMQPSDIGGPSTLSEELESAATRVRKRLGNMSINIIEIGRELLTVKQRLEHGRFLDWVEEACALSRRTAQLMMRATEWAEGKGESVTLLDPSAIYALAAPSTPETVRKEVLSRLKEGQRPAPQIVKDMVRAAKKEKAPTSEKNCQPDGNAQRIAELDTTQDEGVEGGDAQSEYAQTETGQSEAALLEADEIQSNWPEARAQKTTCLQPVSAQGRGQRDPDIDPFKDHDPPWINGALRLIPLLAEAIPLTETIPNRDAIICGTRELIPPLAEAVLELPEIPEQQLIEALLKYCGYNDYAARVSQHSAQTLAIAGAAVPTKFS